MIHLHTLSVCLAPCCTARTAEPAATDAQEAAQAAAEAYELDQNTSVGKVGRSTSIVCTIGPASEAKPKLRKVLEAGMNIMRLNLSHGDHEEQGARIRNLREIMAERRAAGYGATDTAAPIGKRKDAAADSRTVHVTVAK